MCFVSVEGMELAANVDSNCLVVFQVLLIMLYTIDYAHSNNCVLCTFLELCPLTSAKNAIILKTTNIHIYVLVFLVLVVLVL